jgi:hypothetical protein
MSEMGNAQKSRGREGEIVGKDSNYQSGRYREVKTKMNNDFIVGKNVRLDSNSFYKTKFARMIQDIFEYKFDSTRKLIWEWKSMHTDMETMRDLAERYIKEQNAKRSICDCFPVADRLVYSAESLNVKVAVIRDKIELVNNFLGSKFDGNNLRKLNDMLTEEDERFELINLYEQVQLMLETNRTVNMELFISYVDKFIDHGNAIQCRE